MTKTFDKILPYDKTNYTIAVLGDKTGLINTTNGEMLTDFVYDYVTDTEEDWEGFFELLGEKFEPQNDDYFVLTKGMTKDYCTMRKNGKWGVLNNKGDVIIDCKYNNEIEMLYYVLEQTYYIITLDGKDGLWDSNSNMVIEPIYDHIMKSGDKYWLCEIDGKCLIKDINGKTILKNKYDSIVACNECSYFLVRKGNLSGLLDINNNIILNIEYKTLSPVGKNCELFIAQKAGTKIGVIDVKGNIVIDFKYAYINYCINETGEIIFLAQTFATQHIYNTKGEKIWN